MPPVMSSAIAALARFARDEDGLAVTEYGLLLALIAVVLIAAARVVGGDLANWFSKLGSNITTQAAP